MIKTITFVAAIIFCQFIPMVSTGQAKAALVAFLPQTHFYSAPDYTTERKAYLVPPDTVMPLKEADGFVYVEYKNNKGQITKGWLSKTDLITHSNSGDFTMAEEICEEYLATSNNDPIKLVNGGMRENVYTGYLEWGNKVIGFVGTIDSKGNELKLYSDEQEVLICTPAPDFKSIQAKYYSANRQQIESFTLKCADSE